MQHNFEGQVLVDEIGIVGYKFYASIAMKCNPDFHHDCVSILPLYFQDRELSGLELYVSKGVMNPPKVFILRFLTHHLFNSRMSCSTLVMEQQGKWLLMTMVIVFNFSDSSGLPFRAICPDTHDGEDVERMASK